MFDTIPSDEVIQKTAQALKANGIEAFIVDNKAQAKQKLFELVPLGAEIMNNTSVTMDSIGATAEILNSGKYNPVRTKLMDPNVTPKEKGILGATADYTTGSVHAITQEGSLMVASNTGSQLGSEAYPSPHLVFVAGAQKIVKDRDEGFKRIYEHSLPLEAERAKKAYGAAGSNVSKILIIDKEIKPDRIKMILVKEILGF